MQKPHGISKMSLILHEICMVFALWISKSKLEIATAWIHIECNDFHMDFNVKSMRILHRNLHDFHTEIHRVNSEVKNIDILQ